jgi:hypothetical protein
MSGDFTTIGGLLLAAISTVILGLGGYRALEIGRASISRIYRGRAYGTAILLVLTAFLLLDSPPIVPTTSDFFSPLNLVGGFGLVLFEAALFAFIDGAVLVAMDSDFFHRDSLRWNRLRPAFYPIVIVSASVSVLGGSYDQSVQNPPQWLNGGPPLGVLLLLIIYGYSAAALVVSARRTVELTLKRYVRMLGFSVLCVIGALLVEVSYSWSASPISNLPLGVVFVAISYTLYLGVMSLSPMGKMEKVSEPIAQP